IALVEDRSDEALGLLREAADMEDKNEKHPVTPGRILPAREQLGDMLMELKRPAEALKEYERSQQREPDRFPACTAPRSRPRWRAMRARRGVITGVCCRWRARASRARS